MKKVQTTQRTKEHGPLTHLSKEPLKMQVKVVIPYMFIVAVIVFALGLFSGYFASINIRQDTATNIISELHQVSK